MDHFRYLLDQQLRNVHVGLKSDLRAIWTFNSLRRRALLVGFIGTFDRRFHAFVNAKTVPKYSDLEGLSKTLVNVL